MANFNESFTSFLQKSLANVNCKDKQQQNDDSVVIKQSSNIETIQRSTSSCSSLSDNEDQDNNNNEPKWSVSKYGSIHCVNKKNSLLRVSCDKYLTHEWPTFTQMSHALIVNTRFPGYVLIRNVILLLHHKHNLHSDYQCMQHVQYLISEILSIMEERYESLLELIMLLLQPTHRVWLLKAGGRKMIQDFQQINEKWRKNAKKESKSLKVLIETFAIYDEYMDYIDWKSLTNNDRSRRVLVSKLITNLNHILSQANPELVELNLDIVPLILFELYQHQNQISEALQMFCSYRDKHTNNLNAHIYLYEFIKKFHFINTKLDLKMDCLKHIVRLSPDSKYALELIAQPESISMLSLPDRMEMLCQFLDYVHNKDSIDAWKLLQQLMNENENNDDCITTIISCLEWRMPYWQRMHFALKNLESLLQEWKKQMPETSASFESMQQVNQYQLVMYKARFLEHFFDYVDKTIQNDEQRCLLMNDQLIRFKNDIINWLKLIEFV